MIKNTLKVLAAACVALISIVSFTACSNDDNEGSSSKKLATEVTVTTEVYTTAFALKYFKVEAADASGNTVELTTQNTTEVASFPTNVYQMVEEFNPKVNGDKLLKYTFGKETFKSFPKSLEYKTYLTPRDQKPAEGEKVMAMAVPVLTITNNAAGGTQWESMKGGLSLAVTTLTANSWDRYVSSYPKKTCTVGVAFSNASSIELSGMRSSK